MNKKELAKIIFYHPQIKALREDLNLSPLVLRSIVAELNENTQGLTIDAKVAGLKQIGLQYGMKNPNTVLNEWLKYYAGMVKALGDQYWQAEGSLFKSYGEYIKELSVMIAGAVKDYEIPGLFGGNKYGKNLFLWFGGRQEEEKEKKLFRDIDRSFKNALRFHLTYNMPALLKKIKYKDTNLFDMLQSFIKKANDYDQKAIEDYKGKDGKPDMGQIAEIQEMFSQVVGIAKSFGLNVEVQKRFYKDPTTPQNEGMQPMTKVAQREAFEIVKNSDLVRSFLTTKFQTVIHRISQVLSRLKSDQRQIITRTKKVLPRGDFASMSDQQKISALEGEGTRQQVKAKIIDFLKSIDDIDFIIDNENIFKTAFYPRKVTEDNEKMNKNIHKYLQAIFHLFTDRADEKKLKRAHLFFKAVDHKKLTDSFVNKVRDSYSKSENIKAFENLKIAVDLISKKEEEYKIYLPQEEEVDSGFLADLTKNDDIRKEILEIQKYDIKKLMDMNLNEKNSLILAKLIATSRLYKAGFFIFSTEFGEKGTGKKFIENFFNEIKLNDLFKRIGIRMDPKAREEVVSNMLKSFSDDEEDILTQMFQDNEVEQYAKKESIAKPYVKTVRTFGEKPDESWEEMRQEQVDGVLDWYASNQVELSGNLKAALKSLVGLIIKKTSSLKEVDESEEEQDESNPGKYKIDKEKFKTKSGKEVERRVATARGPLMKVLYNLELDDADELYKQLTARHRQELNIFFGSGKKSWISSDTRKVDEAEDDEEQEERETDKRRHSYFQGAESNAILFIKYVKEKILKLSTDEPEQEEPEEQEEPSDQPKKTKMPPNEILETWKGLADTIDSESYMKGAKDFFYVLAKIAESAKKNISYFGVSMGPAEDEKRIKIKFDTDGDNTPYFLLDFQNENISIRFEEFFGESADAYENSYTYYGPEVHLEILGEKFRFPNFEYTQWPSEDELGPEKSKTTKRACKELMVEFARNVEYIENPNPQNELDMEAIKKFRTLIERYNNYIKREANENKLYEKLLPVVRNLLRK